MTTAAAQRERPTVLIVEDHDLVRDFAARVLQADGYGVLTAASGEEGVEVFRRRAGEVDVVLLDLAMPRMSGDEVLREIRKLSPKTRVILASGCDQGDALTAMVRGEFDSFLQKPYRGASLLSKVRAVLAI